MGSPQPTGTTAAAGKQAESCPTTARAGAFTGGRPFSVEALLFGRFPQGVKYLSTAFPQPHKLLDVRSLSFVPLDRKSTRLNSSH